MSRACGTTLTIDDDVLLAAGAGRREKRSTGAILSELARQALTGQQRPATSGSHGFQPLPSRGAAVSNALIDRLREDDPA